jgi:hypothetical protein
VIRSARGRQDSLGVSRGDEEGMGVEQAMIFVGHEFRLRHSRYQPVR